jgi:hypothetical protein
LLVAILMACESIPATAPPIPVAIAPLLQLYGHGSKDGLVTACQEPGYRQFDFWVGHWEITPIRQDGTFGNITPSIIERELDDCVIEENFAGLARSINTYDPASRVYHQQYIDSRGFHLILAGGRRPDAVMEMRGTVFFFCPTCPGGIFPQVNVWTWTAITPDSVRQLQILFSGLSGDSIGRGFDGRYRRRPSVTLPPTPTTGPCTNNPLFRQFDFLVGDWVLTNGRALGLDMSEGGAVSATVTRELGDCLIEEHVTGPGGYKGWSFNAWNQSEDVWYRTYVNNLGERVFLRGNLDGARMVLTGTRSLADGRSTGVRVTWAPDGANRVIETWAVSHDGGATYDFDRELTRIRRVE